VNFGKRTDSIGQSSRMKRNSRGRQFPTNPRSG